MTCTFIGHSNFNSKYSYKIKKVLIDLIENHNVCKFYVGTHGSFDYCAAKVLDELLQIYPHIDYFVVRAYLPRMGEVEIKEYHNPIIFDGFEKVPLRFAISHRNDWMIKQSDYVVSYITDTHKASGAADFAEKAIRWGKTVINIADKN